jgi:hypothetical protein
LKGSWEPAGVITNFLVFYDERRLRRRFHAGAENTMGVELFVILLVDELERDVDVWGLELSSGKLKSGIYDSLT